MKRREFVIGAGAALFDLHAALAQQRAMPVVGFITTPGAIGSRSLSVYVDLEKVRHQFPSLRQRLSRQVSPPLNEPQYFANYLKVFGVRLLTSRFANSQKLPFSGSIFSKPVDSVDFVRFFKPLK